MFEHTKLNEDIIIPRQINTLKALYDEVTLFQKESFIGGLRRLSAQVFHYTYLQEKAFTMGESYGMNGAEGLVFATAFSYTTVLCTEDDFAFKRKHARRHKGEQGDLVDTRFEMLKKKIDTKIEEQLKVSSQSFGTLYGNSLAEAKKAGIAIAHEIDKQQKEKEDKKGEGINKQDALMLRVRIEKLINQVIEARGVKKDIE